MKKAGKPVRPVEVVKMIGEESKEVFNIISGLKSINFIKEMVMNFNSVEEIINYAIEKEKEAVKFYEEISRQEAFSGTRKIFEEFAKEERKHQTMLEDFSINQDKISEYKLEWITDIKRSDYLVDIEYEKGMHYTDILRLAMKKEEKALKLYNDLMQKADNKNVIKLFQLLAQEEAKHKGYIEGLYDDYMAGQGD